MAAVNKQIIQNQKQRLRILRIMQQALTQYNVFDEEDSEFVADAIEQENEIDEELIALQERLPIRQQILASLDDKYNISNLFPELMVRFVEKDADLFALMEEKQRAFQQRR